MGTVLIVVLLIIGVFLAASFALGRTTQEVESARDTEYLELDGTWVRYQISGGGPPVVLVHGLLSSSRIWDELATRLSQRFTVYAMDLRGFGESDKPLSGYGVRYGSRLLYAFCAHFGLSRAAVIGHDLGGAIALKLAADHPDVVGRLVLISVPAEEEQIDLPTPLWLATIPVAGPVFYTLGRFFAPLRKLWLRPFVLDSDTLSEEAVEDAGMSTPAAIGKTLSVLRREISHGRLARQARVIKSPVLAIAGEEDQIVDPQSVGDWAATVNAEVVLLEECGHIPMLEQPNEFSGQVLAFLTSDPRYLTSLAETAAENEAKESEDEPASIEDEIETEENNLSTGEEISDSGKEPIEQSPRDAPGNVPWHEAHGSGDDQEIGPRAHSDSGDRVEGVESGEGRHADEPDRTGRDRTPDTFSFESDEEREKRNVRFPEVPEDLFQWPDAEREPHDSGSPDAKRSRERRRENPGETPEDR